MLKQFLLLLLFFSFNAISAQQRTPVESGVITLSSGQMTGFINLRFINDDLIVYHDVAAKKEISCRLEEVSLIMDDSQNTIFQGAAVIQKQKVAAAKKDSLYKPNYPEGIYKTKEDFVNKKPSEHEPLIPVTIHGRNYLESPENNCFFLKENGNKLKKVFAVSYNGHLYFRIGAILDNRNRTDRAQSNDFPNSFARVITGGENFYYLEAELANAWAQGFAYGGLGGVAGGLVADSVIYEKGIVWDFKNKEFNIFKNCKDFNAFIEPIYPEGIQDCEKQQADIEAVRNVIEKIK